MILSSRFKQTIENGTVTLTPNVGKYQSVLGNIPRERKSGLKSYFENADTASIKNYR